MLQLTGLKVGIMYVRVWLRENVNVFNDIYFFSYNISTWRMVAVNDDDYIASTINFHWCVLDMYCEIYINIAHLKVML